MQSSPELSMEMFEEWAAGIDAIVSSAEEEYRAMWLAARRKLGLDLHVPLPPPPPPAHSFLEEQPQQTQPQREQHHA